MRLVNTATREITNKRSFKQAHSNVSFPATLTNEILAPFSHSILVINEDRPDVTNLQQVLADGVEQDDLDNWVEKWIIADKFEANELHTKAEQETAFLQGLEDTAFESLRTERNRLLAETDWTASTDVTMNADMTTYRQALRDLPASVDINNIVYPEKP